MKASQKKKKKKKKWHYHVQIYVYLCVKQEGEHNVSDVLPTAK